MAIVYAVALKNARLDAITAAAGATAKLLIGDAGFAKTLATIALANPIAPGANAGVLTLTCPQSDTSADDTGTAAEAKIKDSSNNDLITGLTVGVGGQHIVLNSTSITAAQKVTVSTATITHA